MHFQWVIVQISYCTILNPGCKIHYDRICFNCQDERDSELKIWDVRRVKVCKDCLHWFQDPGNLAYIRNTNDIVMIELGVCKASAFF